MIARQPMRRDDTGATLIIALLIVTTVALVTGAMLSHAYTNLRATVSLRGVIGTSYAGDAAAKEAVNSLRLGRKAPEWSTPPAAFPGPWDNWVYTNNTDGTGCFGIKTDGTPDNNLELGPSFYPKAGDQTADTTARVECTVVPGTGIFAGGPGVGINDPDPTDAFARALTTVGTTGTLQGINVKPLGVIAGNVQPLPIRGGVASRSTVNADNGALLTDGYVWADGACTGLITTPDKECNIPGKVPLPVAPPSPLSSVPPFQDPSAEGCSFQPGFYNDAASLTTAVNGCSTARFAAGQYYFDFTDANHSATDTNLWTISTTLIGGDPGPSSTIPGRCRTPIGNDPNNGVQFVFGGSSRIALSDTAHVELCGPSNGGDAPMTFYQQQTGSTPAAVSTNDQTGQNAANGTGNKVKNFTVAGLGTLAQAVSAVGGVYGSAKWAAAAKNDVAALNVRNFSGLSSIPAGSDITSAQVRVNYKKASAATLNVAATDGTQPAPAVSVGAPDAAGWGTADVSDEVRSLIEHGSFTATSPQLELRMTAADKTDTLNIDAVTLSVTYVPPSLRPATDVANGDCSNGAAAGCIISAPGGNFKGQFVVQGATYVPNGYVALVPGSSSPGVDPLVSFRWGLVARGTDFKSQPSQTFGYPLVSIPDAGHGSGSRVTIVDLEVYVCPGLASCDTGGAHTLTARVRITDPPYDTSGTYKGIPQPGRRQMTVLSWSEQS